jgi:hypothetical protein
MEQLTNNKTDRAIETLREHHFNLSDALNKLADYKSTGLEPEEISPFNKELVDTILEQLKEYEDLEMQKLLIILHFKFGDTVFINIKNKTHICKISGFCIDKDETRVMLAFQNEDNGSWFETGESHRMEDLFLTREEAEKALGKQQ